MAIFGIRKSSAIMILVRRHYQTRSGNACVYQGASMGFLWDAGLPTDFLMKHGIAYINLHVETFFIIPNIFTNHNYIYKINNKYD